MRVSESSLLRVDVLGRLTAHTTAGPLVGSQIGSRKARQLLRMLALARGWQSADSLADDLWPAEAPREPPRVVASLVSRLRATFGHAAIQGDGRGYGLATAVTVDVHEASALLEESRARLVAGEPGSAVTTALQAVTLLDQPPEADGESGMAPAAGAEQSALLRRARLTAGEALTRVGRAEQAVAVAGAVVAADPP